MNRTFLFDCGSVRAVLFITDVAGILGLVVNQLPENGTLFYAAQTSNKCGRLGESVSLARLSSRLACSGLVPFRQRVQIRGVHRDGCPLGSHDKLDFGPGTKMENHCLTAFFSNW